MLIKEIRTCEATLCEDEKKALDKAIKTIYSIISEMKNANCNYFENTHDDFTYSIEDMYGTIHTLERLKDMDTIY